MPCCHTYSTVHLLSANMLPWLFMDNIAVMCCYQLVLLIIANLAGENPMKFSDLYLNAVNSGVTSLTATNEVNETQHDY